MEKIKDIWLSDTRIFIRTTGGKEYSRPLEAFPTLKEANEKDRNNFKIGRFGDDIRWETLDEDIHIESFFETKEPDINNEIGEIFRRFPQLNVSEIARQTGINKSLLSKYIYGIKTPSEARKRQIIDALHMLGEELKAI